MGIKTYWVTKYALTQGIFRKDLERVQEEYASSHTPGEHYFLKIGVECFESQEDALIAAEAMRLKKIESLKKQIAKLEKIVFRPQ